MLSNPYMQYRRAQTETSDPGELVVLLYQGAIRFLQRAALAIKSGDTETAHSSIIRAQDIVRELNVSLDHSYGDVASNLSKIYDYAHWRLVQANCKKDLVAIDEITGLLRDLLPAWQEALRIARQRQAAPIPRVSYQAVPFAAS